MKGIDYAWGRPGGKNIKDAGFDFVCRYLSNNPNKNLTIQEVQDFHENGLKIVVVWETTELRPLSGFNGGVVDAKRADELSLTLGWILYKCIYFACDYDFNASNEVSIKDYFKGISSIIHRSRVGVYGEHDVIKYLLDERLCTYAWQTTAWSKGKLDHRANIKQTPKTVIINKIICDYNESLTQDFGQW